MIFAILAALALGIFIGSSISFRHAVNLAVEKRIQAGPLGNLSQKALQIQRSLSALRARSFAVSLVQRRLEELQTEAKNLSTAEELRMQTLLTLEVSSLMIAIASNKSPVENLEGAAEIPTLDECAYRGAVGRKTIEEMTAMAATMEKDA